MDEFVGMLRKRELPMMKDDDGLEMLFATVINESVFSPHSFALIGSNGKYYLVQSYVNLVSCNVFEINLDKFADFLASIPSNGAEVVEKIDAEQEGFNFFLGGLKKGDYKVKTVAFWDESDLNSQELKEELLSEKEMEEAKALLGK
eukprot:TRINITY_DN4556_c0_g1_i4.p1 TRINITY_DN4556_c0_g1~~TRINITY_DN4556_c0_g1_i4.p1  ORF type:complete len:146 (-),score=52.55 TRINITY_DN4556_c0_g1_i4:105-542(-)